MTSASLRNGASWRSAQEDAKKAKQDEAGAVIPDAVVNRRQKKKDSRRAMKMEEGQFSQHFALNSHGKIMKHPSFI